MEQSYSYTNYNHDGRSYETVGEYLPQDALAHLSRAGASRHVGGLATFNTVETDRRAGAVVAAAAGALAVHGVNELATSIGDTTADYIGSFVGAFPGMPDVHVPPTLPASQAYHNQYQLAA